MRPPRIRSLRARIVLAMLLAAFLSLAAMFFVFDGLEQSMVRGDARHEAETAQEVITGLLNSHANDSQLRQAAQAFGDERISISMPGRPPLMIAPTDSSHQSSTVTTVASFGGGVVRVSAPVEPTRTVALELTALGAAVLGIMIGTALAGGTMFSRGVTRPIHRMAAAADRVAGGDLSVRIAKVPSAELDRLAVAFDSMTRRLEEADQLQRRFIGDLAHEIATPLNAVSGFAIALADGTVRGDERAEAIELISLETRRLLGLLNALRDLDSLDLAEPSEFESFDAAQLVNAGTRHLQRAAEAANVRLRVKTRPTEGYGDPRLVSMILENFVTNAIRYTPAGGLVDVTLKEDGDSVILTVRDTGIGIPADEQQRIFDRLYRVDAARTRATGGFGIGLALVQRAALALQGRVEVESEPGKGSEFRLVFRRFAENADPSAKKRQPDQDVDSAATDLAVHT
jgi:signal transduction histidine kinase